MRASSMVPDSAARSRLDSWSWSTRGLGGGSEMTSLVGSLALGVAFVAVLGCSAPAEAVDEDTRVLVLAQPFARADAIWMAQYKEFFKAEGLAVSVKWMPGGADMLRVLGQRKAGRQGFADFIVLSELTAVNFWQRVPP